jgi:membrane associated rhomboid family serine protease
LISVNYSLLLFLVLPIPYGVDKAPKLQRSPVTMLLVLANAGLFLVTHVSGHGLIDPIGLYEKYGVTPASVHAFQLMTYMFQHVSVPHVVWNMLFLALFGPLVERRVGSLAYAVLFVFGGIAAGLMHAGIVMHFAPNSSAAYEPLVGASGAVSAILGLFVVFAWKRPLNLFWPLGALIGRGWYLLELPSGTGIAIWLAQTVVGAVSSLFTAGDSGIAYFAHIGGFLFGMACGLIGGLMPALDRSVQLDHRWQRAPMPEPDNTIPALAEHEANTGLAQLLERAVAAGDYERAESLYAKCRSVGTHISTKLIVEMSELAAKDGLTERAVELRALAKQPR